MIWLLLECVPPNSHVRTATTLPSHATPTLDNIDILLCYNHLSPG